MFPPNISCEDCIVRPTCIEYERGVQCSLLRERKIYEQMTKQMAKGFSSKFLEHINESLIFRTFELRKG